MSSQTPENSPANGNDAIEPIRDGEGANIMGQRNLSREAENRDIIRPPKTDAGTLPNMRWSFADSHIRIEPGGWGRQTTARELPISTAMAGVNMRLDPGGVRELHWHKEAEWGYVLEGRTRVTAIDGSGNTFQDDLGVGDLWYFPPGIPHSIQVFASDRFTDVSLAQWLALTPHELVTAHLNLDRALVDAISAQDRSIVPPLAQVAS
jgi:oxalate decarboxylase